MKKAKAEKLIMEKCLEISEILKKYDKNSDYLSISMQMSKDYVYVYESRNADKKKDSLDFYTFSAGIK